MKRKIFYCANCGAEITDSMGIYMFRDNYLQVKYFDDNASNRFCSQDCACESLFGEYVDYDEVPLDENEEVEEDEDYDDFQLDFLDELEDIENGRSD